MRVTMCSGDATAACTAPAISQRLAMPFAYARCVTESLRCQRPHRCGILGWGAPGHPRDGKRHRPVTLGGARAQGVHLHGKGVLIVCGDTGREGGAHG